ncbi:Outer membrane protein beta-barrel domain-containing protein [Chitinophaga eiseniae]|uniref:Outer membrane protein beta-barrel domain-containing protein n=1 Tax=Chitinophaga eiseniae TaxID=634771 RepID=A0A1T4RNY0_9BACT|nr:porin family protein [Chitinophaga eiseniae]SKA17458.1 Outer membrane protein beta-barrel domain-containing protein [Chitinophaga eiseniae]
MTKKTIFLSFAAMTLSFAAMAQARVGVKGGWNLSNITTSNDGSTKDAKSLSGFNVGVIADLPLVPRILSFQPGVFYTTKGTKSEVGDKNNVTVTNPYAKYTQNPSYIEVPLNFVAKLPVGEHASLFAGVGPYFAFGVAGKNKYEATTVAGTTSGSSSIKWDDDTPFNNGDLNQGRDKWKRFDWGGNVQVGAEISNFLISAQYGIGFAKVYSGEINSTDNKDKNRVFSVSVGYLFGGR